MKKKVEVHTGYPLFVEASGPVSIESRSVQVEKLQGKLLDYAVAYAADVSTIKVMFDRSLAVIQKITVIIGDESYEWNPTNNIEQAKTLIPELDDFSEDITNKLRLLVKNVIGNEFKFEVPVKKS